MRCAEQRGTVMFKKILCALDGSDHSRKALDLAIDMATKYEAALVLLHSLLRNADSAEFRHFAEIEGLLEHVKPQVRRLQVMEERLEFTHDEEPLPIFVFAEIGRHILGEAEIHAREKGVKEVTAVMVDGDAAGRILRCIDEQGIDLVLMGSRGLGDIKAMVLGSVSHKVMNRAPCTCIAVK